MYSGGNDPLPTFGALRAVRAERFLAALAGATFPRRGNQGI